MNAENAASAAFVAALRADATLAASLNGVFDGPPIKATTPYAEIGELLGVDWGVKDRAGRELRLAVTLRDAGETPLRVQALAAAAGAAIEALPRALDGWDVASLVLVRSRIAATAPGRWNAMLDYRLRLLAQG